MNNGHTVTPSSHAAPQVTWVHSLSTAPMDIDLWGIGGLGRLKAQTYYFALSLAYLKRAGRRVVLHTDTLGAAFLGHLPYDEIHLTLDCMKADGGNAGVEGCGAKGIHPRYWAAGKFFALLAEDAPCIHLDGDVFIKRPELALRIESMLADAPVIVQSPDDAKMYDYEKPLYDGEEAFCKEHFCFADGKDAYNTGILGFASNEVKDAVCDNYMNIVQYMSAHHATELDEGTQLTPDLIAEQKMLEQYTRLNGIPVATLLTDPKEALDMGYQHVFTLAKFFDTDLCRRSLERVAPDIYAPTFRLCGIVETPKNLTLPGAELKCDEAQSTSDE